MSRRTTGIASGDGGFALVITMLMTTLIVAVVTELIHQVYVDVSINRGFRDAQQASLFAESGVMGAIKLIQLGNSSRSYTSLNDPWSKPIKLDDENGLLVVNIADESAKLNLNSILLPNGTMEPYQLAAFQRIGRRLKAPEELWSAVADWIDKDDQPRSGGAETAYYRSLKYPYSSHDDYLLTIDELSLLKGVTPALLGALKPFVTIYSQQQGAPVSTVNINTAPKEILAALDDQIDDRMADRIIEERKLKPFSNPGELSRIVGAEAISQRLVGKTGVKSSLFRINAVSTVHDASRTVEAVVRIPDSGNPEILSWQEY